MPDSRSQASKELNDVDNLSRRYGKFALVAGVAKRSRELKERIESVLVPSSGGLVRRAISEIAEGKVRILPPADFPGDPQVLPRRKAAVTAAW